MPFRVIEKNQFAPHPFATVLLYVACTLAMAYLRLVLFSDHVITITYALPLVICLWYPSRRLLWSMAATFTVMAGISALHTLRDPTLTTTDRFVIWGTQIANIVIISIAVHLIVRLIETLRQSNSALAHTNDALVEREEEISRQNEELQAQSEELARQNEEIEQQAEELQHQNDELEAQAVEVQAANAELARRQRALEGMLHALHGGSDTATATRKVCDAALELLAEHAVAAAVLLREGDSLVVRGSAGAMAPDQQPWPLAHSLAEVVLQQRRAASISDLSLRPDVIVPTAKRGAFRAILAAPVWLDDKPAGALEFYADQPHHWNQEHFAIVEWAAAQCSLILEARRLRDELRAANLVLEGQVAERTQQLQDLVNELEHFSYTITHDLRAPLRAMQGYAGILEEDYLKDLDETGRSFLRRITVAATRMDQLITDALSYSRAVRQELAMVPVDPARLLRNMVDSYPHLQPPNAEIELLGDLPQVLANEAGLTQCFSNLLGNAVKFVAAGVRPRVRVRAEQNDGVVRLWFEDNGIGIAPEMQSRLFSMFQRLSKDYEGTGIGLALVRKVAERMGGTVGVESSLGRGSRFWLQLRAAPQLSQP